MSHEIKIHEAQTSILRELLFLPTAGYTDLQKPTGLASDHFNFHIGRLVELGLVEKTERGKYRLTMIGKEYANRLDTEERKVERQGKIGVLVIPTRRRDDGVTEYMAQQRLKHPYYGYFGFVTGKLRWGETVLQGAARELAEEAGLRADLHLRGLYHMIDYAKDGRLLEDKHFYMMEAKEPAGELIASYDGGKNSWHTLEEIEALPKMFQGAREALGLIQDDGMVFREKSFEIEPEEY